MKAVLHFPVAEQYPSSTAMVSVLASKRTSGMSGGLFMNYGTANHIAASANRLNIKRFGVIAVVINSGLLPTINAGIFARAFNLTMANCSCNCSVCALLSNDRKLADSLASAAPHWLSAFCKMKYFNLISAIYAVRNSVDYFPFEIPNSLLSHLSGLFASLREELSASHDFDLVLTAERRIFTPSVDGLPGLKTERVFQRGLRSIVLDCV